MGPIRLLALCAVFALLAAADGSVVLARSRADLGFSSAVSERLMDAYTRRFGPAARARLETWKRYAAQHRGAAFPVEDLLLDVNRTLNRIRFVDDMEHWGEAD